MTGEIPIATATGLRETAEFRCPGEEYAISRSVHLARLAAFYPKCRDCPHRGETGQLPAPTVTRLRRTQRRAARPTLFEAEGVRGRYLNELNRETASRYAGALARFLWDDAPLRGAVPDRTCTVRSTGPLLVIGYDERPSSPDVVSGVASMLGRMSCQVVDIGLTTAPCFEFAVDHLNAAAGIFVTGSGHGPSWTGLDFAGAGGVPFSRGGSLDEIAARFETGYGRPTRTSAARRSFQAALPYETGLWKHFHALRPLTVTVAGSRRLTRETLARLFSSLPCSLQLVALPDRVRSMSNPDDPDVLRVGDVVRRTGSHLGLLIDDDDRRCGFFDERGRLVPPSSLAALFVELVRSDDVNASATIDERLAPLGGATAIEADPTAECLVRTMTTAGASFGATHDGRYWFREPRPTCDAIVTLAKMLQVLSQSDRMFSEVAAV